MRTNLAIAALIYPMVQAVVFGIGLVLILLPPLRSQAMSLMPWMIATTFAISVPIAAAIAPKLRSRRFKARRRLRLVTR
ncbi:MAG: hypothetical protein ACOY5Y_15765 [Pseudomonadota bacterium]|jgi:hypothetical protein